MCDSVLTAYAFKTLLFECKRTSLLSEEGQLHLLFGYHCLVLESRGYLLLTHVKFVQEFLLAQLLYFRAILTKFGDLFVFLVRCYLMQNVFLVIQTKISTVCFNTTQL